MYKPVDDVSIIIPSRALDELTKFCVTKVRELYPEAEIILVVDSVESHEFITAKNVRVAISHENNIALKRNIGVKAATKTYLAFIDSDAFPKKGWLEEATLLLKENLQIGIVGGPNLPTEDQSFCEELSFRSCCSPLVAMNCKDKTQSQKSHYRNLVSSCNMVVRRRDYNAVDGMNPDLHVMEDLEFCKRIIKELGKSIYYSDKVIVHHRNREFKGFLGQRFTYGMLATHAVLKNKNYNLSLSLVPMGFILFLLSLAIASIFSTVAVNFLFGVIFLYLVLIVFEAIRVSSSIKQVFPLMVYLLLGNLLPGAGGIYNLAWQPKLKYRFYKNWT